MTAVSRSTPSASPLDARSPPAFRLENVSVEFAATAALEDVTLDVRRGEAIAFVGPSGSGKTTLLRLLNGTLRPTRGRVLVGDTDLATLSLRELRRVRSRIGFVHQDLSLVPNLRVVQNVAAGQLGRRSFAASVRLMTRASRRDLATIHAILERVGIEEKIFEPTRSLSGGQRQRVALARALFQEPLALLADEPVSSVDPARARDTVELLTRISREEDLTLCMSLHHLDLARACFPRIVGLRSGRVVFDESSSALDDRRFEKLYALTADEMLVDGA